MEDELQNLGLKNYEQHIFLDKETSPKNFFLYDVLDSIQRNCVDVVLTASL
jgi:hypothetical protein